MPNFDCHLCDATFVRKPDEGFQGFEGVQLMLHLHEVHGFNAHQCTRALTERMPANEAEITHTHTHTHTQQIKRPTRGHLSSELLLQNWQWN
jgi:hypothetical protein